MTTPVCLSSTRASCPHTYIFMREHPRTHLEKQSLKRKQLKSAALKCTSNPIHITPRKTKKKKSKNNFKGSHSSASSLSPSPSASSSASASASAIGDSGGIDSLFFNFQCQVYLCYVDAYVYVSYYHCVCQYVREWVCLHFVKVKIDTAWSVDMRRARTHHNSFDCMRAFTK